MPALYNLFEKYVNLLIKLFLEFFYTDEEKASKKFGPMLIQFVVQLITLVFFTAVVLYYGVFLWNRGLQPAFPGVVAKLSPSDPNQLGNTYSQLVLTMLAVIMLF